MANVFLVDAILDAAISCSPHTTPSKTFPDHHAKWAHSIERNLFNVPDELIKNLPPDWQNYLEEHTDEGTDQESEDTWLVVKE